jgi:AraC-like DNA-binding protein
MYATEATSYYTQNTTTVDGAHIHPCYEIYVNVSGDISFLHENSICDIRSGDVIISYPGDVHYCIYHSSCTHGHFCIWFQSEEVGAFLARRGIRGKVRPASTDASRLLQIAHSLTDTEQDPFIRAAKFMEFLMLLDTEEKSKHEHSEIVPTKLEEMLSYIDAHLLTVHGGDELARVFFTSESTVNRMFKKYIGKSPLAFRTAHRLQQAKERLLHTTLSVEQIASSIGYSDPLYFSRVFHAHVGVSPREFRKNKEITLSKK